MHVRLYFVGSLIVKSLARKYNQTIYLRIVTLQVDKKLSGPGSVGCAGDVVSGRARRKGWWHLCYAEKYFC